MADAVYEETWLPYTIKVYDLEVLAMKPPSHNHGSYESIQIKERSEQGEEKELFGGANASQVLSGTWLWEFPENQKNPIVGISFSLLSSPTRIQ